MAAIRDTVAALAAGQPVGAIQLTWAVFDGMRGATWTHVQADGRVWEQRYVPGPRTALGQQAPLVELGIAPPDAVRALAAALLAHDFDQVRLPPPPPPIEALDVGVQLAVTLDGEEIRVHCPSSQLGQVPALAAIGQAFRRLRTQIRPPR